MYAFSQGLFWYLIRGAGWELVGFAPGTAAAVVRLALDERWMQGPVIIYPHGDRLFCECALGQVSAWVLRDSEGFYLEGTRYCGPLLGFFGSKRVVWRPRGLGLCDENGALSLALEYPKENPLLSPDVLSTVIEKKQIGQDAIEAVLGEHVLVSAQGTPPPYMPWCAARHDGSLLAMHADRLLRRWGARRDLNG